MVSNFIRHIIAFCATPSPTTADWDVVSLIAVTAECVPFLSHYENLHKMYCKPMKLNTPRFGHVFLPLPFFWHTFSAWYELCLPDDAFHNLISKANKCQAQPRPDQARHPKQPVTRPNSLGSPWIHWVRSGFSLRGFVCSK